MSLPLEDDKPVDPFTIGAMESPVSIHYEREASRLLRSIRTPIGSSSHVMPLEPDSHSDRLDLAWHLRRLRGVLPAPSAPPRGSFKTVDLFSGAGGLALGTTWAVEAVGRRHKPLLAADIDPDAIDVNQYNHLPRKTYVGSVRDLFAPGALSSARDPSQVSPESTLMPGAEWLAALGPVDLVTGGPPCQGHSNLNNRTRRVDDRNQLYYWMALAAHALQAKTVVIENVASVKADAGDVVGATIRLLELLDYVVLFDDVLSADRTGVAQSRRRHFLIAIRRDVLGPHASRAGNWLSALEVSAPSVMDVIGDLEDLVGTEEYDLPSELSDENRSRIDYLFDEGVFDLPNHIRPESHREGHTYPSVYGRMYPDRPAGTLSTGFLSPGRGRYVHPTRRRTMTLHEGARVQGFPDDFRFIGASGKTPNRTAVARMIGDAVPPAMAFHVILAALAATKDGALGTA